MESGSSSSEEEEEQQEQRRQREEEEEESRGMTLAAAASLAQKRSLDYVILRVARGGLEHLNLLQRPFARC